MNIFVRKQDNDLCKYLSKEQCTSLLSASMLLSCPDSTAILAPGDEPEGIIMMLSGELEIRSSQHGAMGSIFPGEIFGEITFMGVANTDIGLTSVKPSSYHILPFNVLNSLISQDDELAARIMAAINDSLCLKTIHLTHYRNHGQT